MTSSTANTRRGSRAPVISPLLQRALALRSFSKYVAPLLRGWEGKMANTNPA